MLIDITEAGIRINKITEKVSSSNGLIDREVGDHGVGNGLIESKIAVYRSLKNFDGNICLGAVFGDAFQSLLQPIGSFNFELTILGFEARCFCGTKRFKKEFVMIW